MVNHRKDRMNEARHVKHTTIRRARPAPAARGLSAREEDE
jgi:hypothetical protein